MEYRLTCLSSSGKPTRMPEVNLMAESLEAAKVMAEHSIERFGGPFSLTPEAILSDPSEPSVVRSRWIRGRGWVDSPAQTERSSG